MEQSRLLPLVRRLKVLDKDTHKEIPLEPNWAQLQFLNEVERLWLAGKPIRIIVLKARQLGISTITEAVLFWWGFIHPGNHALIISHEAPSSRHLYEMTRRFWETFPFRKSFTVRSYTQQQLAWDETGSSIKIATAANTGSGRGQTLHAVHGSEVALWPEPEELMTGLSQTVPATPNTIVVLESTAKGVGNYFYNMWNDAVAGENDYVPLFLPWHKHGDYTGAKLNLTEPLGDFDDQELWLVQNFQVDEDHLRWRRYIIRNQLNGDADEFAQEYPVTPEEAFLRTGRPVFDQVALQRCYKPKVRSEVGRLVDSGGGIKFVPDRRGDLTIFRHPSPDHNLGQYIVAGDPTFITEGDPACVQVLNRVTFEQVAVFHKHLDPYHLADELYAIGRYYNDALLNTEVEGPGYGTMFRLIDMNYPNLWTHRRGDQLPGKKPSQYMGWSTNYQRKHWAIGYLQGFINDGSITIHDPVTFSQLRNYITKTVGQGVGFEPSEGHDDAVMALAIAVATCVTEPPAALYADSESPSSASMFGEPVSIGRYPDEETGLEVR